MYKLYFFLVFFTLFYFCSYSQEKNDTLDIHSGYSEQQIDPSVFDYTFFNIYFPLCGDYNVKGRMISMIFKDLENVSKYQTFSYSSNSFYQFYSKGFYFWENNVPLMLGTSIHLNEVFGWDKLDVFMDGQGGLYNVYNAESGVFVSSNEKAFSWNAGAGVGYKISKGNTIFIKTSVSMKNFSPIGNSNMSGVNMKF